MPNGSGPLPINSLATGLLKSRKTKTISTEGHYFWAIFIAFFKKRHFYKLMDKNNNL
jgi:hypothetical protein